MKDLSKMTPKQLWTRAVWRYRTYKHGTTEFGQLATLLGRTRSQLMLDCHRRHQDDQARQARARKARIALPRTLTWATPKPGAKAGATQAPAKAQDPGNTCTDCGVKNLKYVIGCPDGAEICQACFDGGAH